LNLPEKVQGYRLLKRVQDKRVYAPFLKGKWGFDYLEALGRDFVSGLI